VKCEDKTVVVNEPVFENVCVNVTDNKCVNVTKNVCEEVDVPTSVPGYKQVSI
jgi:hypothetical protein